MSPLSLFLRSRRGGRPGRPHLQTLPHAQRLPSRARGPLTTVSVVLTMVAFIPACAGSTMPCASSPTCSGDHPRMRGVHWVQVDKTHRGVGSSPHARGPPTMPSSPHARGPLAQGLCQLVQRGIIPACAGSTSHTPCCWCPSQDHPRMRGVHSRFFLL